MKTCLYNFDPLYPHFYIVKQGFTGVYIIFAMVRLAIRSHSLGPGQPEAYSAAWKFNDALLDMFQQLLWPHTRLCHTDGERPALGNTRRVQKIWSTMHVIPDNKQSGRYRPMYLPTGQRQSDQRPGMVLPAEDRVARLQKVLLTPYDPGMERPANFCDRGDIPRGL